MGVLIDTSVLIAIERGRPGPGLASWGADEGGYISAITCSELLVGVHRADTVARQHQRSAFVEALLGSMVILEIDADVARAHARIVATLAKGVNVDAHDMWIGATAMRHGLAVLTANVVDFARIPGLEVLNFSKGTS